MFFGCVLSGLAADDNEIKRNDYMRGGVDISCM